MCHHCHPEFAFSVPSKTRKFDRTSGNSDERRWCERYGSIVDFTSQTALHSCFQRISKAVCDVKSRIDPYHSHHGRGPIWKKRNFKGKNCKTCFLCLLLVGRRKIFELGCTLKLIHVTFYDLLIGCFANELLMSFRTMILFFARSALRFGCGIFVFGVTWILLRRSSEENISSATWKQFMVSHQMNTLIFCWSFQAKSGCLFVMQFLGLIIICTGTVFNVIFHAGIKEPPSDALQRWLDEHNNEKRKRGRNGPEQKGEHMFVKVVMICSPVCFVFVIKVNKKSLIYSAFSHVIRSRICILKQKEELSCIKI